MAESNHHTRELEPTNGFCAKTKTFHSLRPSLPLPPPSLPISLTDFLLSLLPPSSSSSSSSSSFTFLVDAATGNRLNFPCFISQCHALSSFLVSRFPSLSKNDVALVLPPLSLHVPVIYFTLLSLGIVVSPANPLSSASEISHLVGLSKPVVAFATSQTSHKLPTLRHGTILIDLPEFESVLTRNGSKETGPIPRNVNRVTQSDPATILYSSGTTGRVKGVLMTHGNMIAALAGPHQAEPDPKPVWLFPLPLFHVYGFVWILKAFGMGATALLMGKFELEAMLRAVDKYGADTLLLSPPVVLALVKSEHVGRYHLSSLRTTLCGGAPLGKEVSERFQQKFPNVELKQGYALTESLSGSGMMGPDETKQYGSVGRLSANMEAKIVDPVTGEALPPGCKGELWLRGPAIMKGYVGDDKATADTLDPDGWLKTGDLCYFDLEGFLYIVDRLKELIKYKAYRVPPAELEHLLTSHPQIAEAAVIPYPDEEAGQVPMAFVVRKPGAYVAESEIMDFIAEQVTPYKKIRRVAFISSIPKNPAGKILRRELIGHALSAGSTKL
ncbi:4-coumarate--CoA ligase-like 9 [Rhodamnia argentea]|uniref:4-coumarate--CoA ligase-like 9 n=1 Tax=Rhodamnia argentea TaxID=178133 RepID=A0ABM3HP85_9MYRT|nr:4-coumarate--CoA ligase-like 9 [Rhodamnia argentea]